jgi:cellulose synthase/poly-beta-1,6-N-acetylglucosamine synthase-like glycosyltransferase
MLEAQNLQDSGEPLINETGEQIKKEIDETGMKKKKGLFITINVLLTILVVLNLFFFYFPLQYKGGLHTLVSVILFGFIILFSYYGLMYLMTPFVNHFYVRRFLKKAPKSLEIGAEKLVAILYPTCNDFDEIAAQSYLQLDYRNYHLFILDDGKDPEYQKRIREFKQRNREQITVVRRATNKAYKAGNLNNAIFNYCKDYWYLLVVDADEVVPVDFLKKLVRYFGIDEKIAYVQSSSTGREETDNPFAEDLRYYVNLYWDNFLPLKNKYGFSAALGHGVIFRKDVLLEVGGFPEIVSEDIALTLKIREKGYYGLLAPDVWGYESFPPTIQAFRKRQFRWTKADLEVCFTHLRTYIRAKGISLTEKWDAITREFKIPITGLLPIYLVLIGSFGNRLFINSSEIPVQLHFINCACLLLVSFGPFWGYIFKLYKTPFKLLKFLVNWFFLGINIIFLQFYAVLSYTLTQKVVFVATGAKENKRSGGFNLKEILNASSPNHLGYLLVEFSFGVLLLILSIIYDNVFFIGIALGLILYWPVLWFGWGHPMSEILKGIPSMCIVGSLLTDIVFNSVNIADYISLIGIALILI